jgi:hypothetical protein
MLWGQILAQIANWRAFPRENAPEAAPVLEFPFLVATVAGAQLTSAGLHSPPKSHRLIPPFQEAADEISS